MCEIELYLTPYGWVAKSDSFREAMGTDVLATPFTVNADKSTVLNTIKRLNPDCVVTVKS